MIEKRGWLKNAVAKPTGYYSPKGEKLKGVALTQEFCDEFNGVVKAAPAPEPVVEEVVVEEEEVEIVEEAPKKKKKGFFKRK